MSNYYVDSFYNFSPNDGTINMSELFSLNENGSAARYSKEEFKSIFRDSLLESDGYADEEILESAHTFYELNMLFEGKSHWLGSNEQSMYLDCDSHVLIINNGEGFLIEQSTFEAAKSLNEGLWDKITSGWNYLKDKAKKAVGKIKDMAVKGWETLSYGAKKAWEFVKMCANAVVEFVKGMTFLEWAALTMSILSAILGILGAVAAGSGAFAWLTPILGTLAGVFQAVGGGIHVYEGYHKITIANKILKKNPQITPTAKLITSITQGLPEYVEGGGMIALGIYDITKAATSPIDPSSGSQSVATGTATKSALKSAVAKIGQPGHVIHGFIEHAGTAMLKKFGVSVATKVGEQAVGKIFTAVVSTVASSILSSVLGFIWKFILKAGQTITKGFDYLLKIPAKISGAIGNFEKKASNWFTKMIAKGLGKIVKPMTDAASKAINKYIQPVVDNVKNWFERQITAYNESEKLMKEYKHELHTGIKHHEVKKPPKPSGKNPFAPKQEIKITKKDIRVSKKIKAKVKGKSVKESSIWENKYIQSFDDLEFI